MINFMGPQGVKVVIINENGAINRNAVCHRQTDASTTY